MKNSLSPSLFSLTQLLSLMKLSSHIILHSLGN